MEINIPESSNLEQPHLIGKDILEARRSFWELAKSRIVYRNQQEHIDFEKTVFGPDHHVSSAIYVLQAKNIGEGDNFQRWVKALEISVNVDFFGEEYKDLIPYAIEHEIYEAWIGVKRGMSPKEINTGHLLARRRQFRMAMTDGKAEKLLKFYKQVNLDTEDELQQAYDKAQKHMAANNSSDSNPEE